MPEQSIMNLFLIFWLNLDKIIVFHFIGPLLFLSCLFLDYIIFLFVCVVILCVHRLGKGARELVTAVVKPNAPNREHPFISPLYTVAMTPHYHAE